MGLAVVGNSVEGLCVGIAVIGEIVRGERDGADVGPMVGCVVGL